MGGRGVKKFYSTRLWRPSRPAGRFRSRGAVSRFSKTSKSVLHAYTPTTRGRSSKSAVLMAFRGETLTANRDHWQSRPVRRTVGLARALLEVYPVRISRGRFRRGTRFRSEAWKSAACNQSHDDCIRDRNDKLTDRWRSYCVPEGFYPAATGRSFRISVAREYAWSRSKIKIIIEYRWFIKKKKNNKIHELMTKN